MFRSEILVFVSVECVYTVELLYFYSTGILTQVVTDGIMKPYGKTYIPASYVKYIESGGSRVMPIRWVEQRLGFLFLNVFC